MTLASDETPSAWLYDESSINHFYLDTSSLFPWRGHYPHQNLTKWAMSKLNRGRKETIHTIFSATKDFKLSMLVKSVAT